MTRFFPTLHCCFLPWILLRCTLQQVFFHSLASYSDQYPSSRYSFTRFDTDSLCECYPRWCFEYVDVSGRRGMKRPVFVANSKDSFTPLEKRCRRDRRKCRTESLQSDIYSAEGKRKCQCYARGVRSGNVIYWSARASESNKGNVSMMLH